MGLDHSHWTEGHCAPDQEQAFEKSAVRAQEEAVIVAREFVAVEKTGELGEEHLKVQWQWEEELGWMVAMEEVLVEEEDPMESAPLLGVTASVASSIHT